jgi:lysophospholipase L1-like esterase
MKSTLLVLGLTLIAAPLYAGEPGLISAMDTLQFKSPKEKGSAVLVDGKVGKAIRFAFDKDARSVFCVSNLRGRPEWDEAAGFSFWVQGDGSDAFGGLQFIYADDFAVRYDYAFPIKSKEWTKITVAWSDLVPVLPGPSAKRLGGPDGNRPSKLSALWFGKWWYWGEYPAYSFAIDEIRLEPKIARDDADYRPAGAPLERTRDKLRSGKAITLVTMGDSLTDVKHWANRKTNWVGLLEEKIKKKYGSDVTVTNPAIGGTQLRQNLVLMPRWLAKTPQPDLVTVCFGGNDWDSGMRGDEFHRSNLDAIDRIRRATKGKSDVLLLTTVPAVTRWQTLAELADACRRASKEKNAGIADTERAFHEAGSKDREHLFVSDRVHLSPEGHAVVADTVLRAIESGGN